jgi:hypothetical protein
MFYVYVLKSAETGHRYVGPCEDLDDRLLRHNAGESNATKTWRSMKIASHREFCPAQRSCDKGTLLQNGRGRDELNPLATCRRGDRSTKLSYTPNFCSCLTRAEAPRMRKV